MMNANSEKQSGFDPFVLSLMLEQPGGQINPMMLQMMMGNKMGDMGPLLPLFNVGMTEKDPLIMMLMMVNPNFLYPTCMI